MKNTIKKILDMIKYRVPAIIIAAAMLAAFVPPIEAKADNDTNGEKTEVTFAIVPSGYTHAAIFKTSTTYDPAPDAPSKITVDGAGTDGCVLTVSALKDQNMYLGTFDESGLKKTTTYRATNGLNYYPPVIIDSGKYERTKTVLGMEYRYYALNISDCLSQSLSDCSGKESKYDVYIIPMMTGDGSNLNQKSNVDGAVVTVAYPQAGGTTSGDRVSQESVTTTITATPNPGYRFDHWEYMRKDGDNSTQMKMKDAGSAQSMEVSVNGGYVAYVAIFKKLSDGAGVYTQANPSSLGTTSGDTARVVNGQTVNSTTIVAYPNKGYVLDHWGLKVNGAGTETNVSTSTSLTVSVDDTKKEYTAYFVHESSGNGVTTTPDDAKHGITTGDTPRIVNGQLINSTTITAEAFDGYVFDYWSKKHDGNEVATSEFKSTIPTLSVKVEDHKDEYTAHFKASDDANGVITRVGTGGGGTTSGDTLRIVNGQKVNSTTITAYPDTGYVFEKWTKTEDDATSDYSDSASVTVKVEDKKTVYTAYFIAVEDSNGVQTKPDDTKHGTTTGDTTRVVNGQLVNSTTITATAFDGYVFDYWTLERGGVAVPDFKSTNSTLTVKVGAYKDVYTAHFKTVDQSNGVTTTASPSEWGTTSGDTLRVVNGQKVSSTTIVAYPNDGYVFDHWGKSVDGGTETRFSTTASISVNVGDNKTVYTAYFKVEKDGNGVFTEPDDASHGTTSGDTLRVVNGQKINQTTLTAYPSSNEWIFDYWTVTTSTVTNQRVSNANPFTVAVTDERKVYTAHFRERGSTTKEKISITGHSTGATSKIDKTKDREFTSAAVGVDSGIMVAKAGDAVDSSRSRLSSDTARNPVNVGVERLNDTLVVNEKKTSEGLKSEEFRLLAGDGNEIALENAAASEYENAKAAAEEQVAKKYGQYYKAEVMLVCNTQIPGGYTDGKQTFVWSGTGAKKGERLMIIQQRDDEKDKIITPVADDDGVLTFSASVIGSSRLILVRAVTKK